jgi:hypothetical protein
VAADAQLRLRTIGDRILRQAVDEVRGIRADADDVERGLVAQGWWLRGDD